MTERAFRARFRILGIMVGTLIAGLGGRLALLHLQRNPDVRLKASEVREYKNAISVRRGGIYDRHGGNNVLAVDLEVHDICAKPRIVVGSNRVEHTAELLARTAGAAAEEVAAKLNSATGRYARLMRFVPPETVLKVREQKPLGLFFPETKLRHYPHGSFMCHVLGFVNYEGAGSAGVEQYMDRFLRGSTGLLESEKDALRRELYQHRNVVIPAIDGADVNLTVDQNVQYIVEKVLDEVMEQHRAKGAWAIVQRVHTGEILALASRPAYDLNHFRTAEGDARLNRAIGSVYEPGSTLKVVAFSAALGEGVVTQDTVFDCENGAWMYGGKPLRDYHPYGRLSVADGLKKSSNIMTAKIALMLGDQRLHKYFRAYGLGDKMGLDLPGEEQGLLSPPQLWSKISATRMAIGQGIAVTAVQMLGLFCSIANGGSLMRPYVISQVRGQDGAVLYEGRPEVLSHPISPDTAALMRTLLKGVTEEGGTGKRARVAGYEVAGKTGTAQKAVGGSYSSSEYVASFVGFLPADNPEIGLIVVVDEPQPFHTGGVVAGPAFSRIADQAVRYLDIPPAGRGNVVRR